MHGTQACNAHALRQAARHVSALYDQALAPYGLRSTQFSVLARLAATGPWSMQVLATKLVMDRTTLARAVQPLERDRLVIQSADPLDRRIRLLSLTEAGAARHKAALEGWRVAQARYEAAIGEERAARLRAEWRDIAATTF